MQTIEQILKELKIDTEKTDSNGIQNTPSGFDKMDRYTTGFQNGQLTILGGRPSMGKSMFAINIARNLTNQNNLKVAVFTLKYSAKKWTNLFIKSMNLIHDKELETKDMQSISNQLFINDTKNISIIELMEKVTTLKKSENVDFLIVDYLQLITGIDGYMSNLNEHRFEKITRLLKILASIINIPILLLSNIPYRKEKKSRFKNMPRLAYLKEYGHLENYAEVILLLHRWDYYDYKKSEDGDDLDLTNKLELTVAKNQNGAITGINLQYNSESKTFKEI